jgi:hypothetical protein
MFGRVALMKNNQPEVLTTPAMIQKALEYTDVFYFNGGTGASISSIKVKGGGHGRAASY